ncbi:MAG: hypothetical protein FJW40_18795 [Acidobacteria bacterium]|nr:hypothetical protein [Acidobacteriota bacterium]
MKLLTMLTRLYPAGFRARYGAEIEAVLREAGGGVGWRWVVREAGGLMAGALREWVAQPEAWESAGRRVGAVAAALLMQGIAYVVLTPVGAIPVGAGTYYVVGAAVAGVAAGGWMVSHGRRKGVAV